MSCFFSKKKKQLRLDCKNTLIRIKIIIDYHFTNLFVLDILFMMKSQMMSSSAVEETTVKLLMALFHHISSGS